MLIATHRDIKLEKLKYYREGLLNGTGQMSPSKATHTSPTLTAYK